MLKFIIINIIFNAVNGAVIELPLTTPITTTKSSLKTIIEKITSANQILYSLVSQFGFMNDETYSIR